jgi:hypothetical protein
MIHTLTPDRFDQPFRKTVLPGRDWGNWLISDAHGAKSARDNGTVGPIAVPDHMTRSPIPRKCLYYLTSNPFCRRICCNGNPDTQEFGAELRHQWMQSDSQHLKPASGRTKLASHRGSGEPHVHRQFAGASISGKKLVTDWQPSSNKRRAA